MSVREPGETRPTAAWSPTERSIADRLRTWDPAAREALPSESEAAWFRERLLAEARANRAAASTVGIRIGWPVAVAIALLLFAVTLFLVRRSEPSRDPSARQARLQESEGTGRTAGPGGEAGPGAGSAPVEPAGETEPESDPNSAASPGAVPVPDSPVAPREPEALPVEVAALSPSSVATSTVPPRSRTRQLQLRSESGTRLLWTFDPAFEWSEAGD